MTARFPFSAILGQTEMQTALLISAVDPAIGGVLIRGQKGTAKSTAARALASLLPAIRVVADCPYHCDPDGPAHLLHPGCRERLNTAADLPRQEKTTPFVDLPLSTTEDRLVGTLHLEHTLRSGQRHFEPGLFAAAHRGILYVDEVNLLPDHLVDLLLDTAVSGQNLVEREGLQFSHASRFILIGTMNPEEGELRPQFLDRFGLCVTIAGLHDRQLRGEIVTRRLAYDRDPEAFLAGYHEEETLLCKQLDQARTRLEEIVIPPDIIDRAAAMAQAARVQGHRAELALVRAARALAALLDHTTVTPADLTAVASFALAHRFPDQPVLSPAEVHDRIVDLLAGESPGDRNPRPDTEDLALMDNIDFPGAAAAGSMLFTYLKKKLTTGSSAPTNLST